MVGGYDSGKEGDSQREAHVMTIHVSTAKLSALRAFAAPAHCPHCGDLMVAPMMSEFVEGGEIRHHWECEVCGELSQSSIPLTR
jgi:hypothetical protein